MSTARLTAGYLPGLPTQDLRWHELIFERAGERLVVAAQVSQLLL